MAASRKRGTSLSPVSEHHNDIAAGRTVKEPLSDSEIHRYNDLQRVGLYESILDGITCGVWVSDADDIIYYVNKGMEMIAGVTHQRLIGYDVLGDCCEGTIDYFKQYYLEAKETLQTVYYSDVPVVTPAGKQTYQSGWLIPRVKDTHFDGMICILEDITNQKEIKKALHESESRYEGIVENVNSVIMRIDVNGNITFMNRFAQEFFGYGPDEIIGENVIGTIVPDEEMAVDTFRALLGDIGKKPEQYAKWEFRNVHRSGEKSWISWSNKPLYDEKGEVIEILCVGNDITELKYNEQILDRSRSDLEKKLFLRTYEVAKANEDLKQEVSEHKWIEEKLRKSEEKYRLVIENANEAIMVVQDGMCKYLNPKTEKIVGYSKEELMSNPIIELIVHPDDKDMVREKYLKRLKGDTVPSVYSYRIVDKEGNIKWLETNSVLITWMGRPAALAFFNNVTERKISEERLRLLESAFQHANDSIIITTTNPDHPSSQVVYVNPAFSRMTGYSAEELYADPSIILQGPRTEGSEWHKLETRNLKEKAYSIETVNYKKDGTKIYLEWQISPISDDSGKITHFVSIYRDITERKKAEKKVIEYQGHLRSMASEMLLTEEKERRRISAMLHDHIGQSLAIAKIKLGVLRDVLPDSGGDEVIHDIRTLIEKSIQYSKSLTFELSPPILYELGFASAVEWFGEQIQKHHNICFEFHDDAEPKPLKKDFSVLLFQVVREIFMNIIKHAHAKSVKAVLQRDGKVMNIILEDDGIGFDTSAIDKKMSFGFFSIRERLRYIGGSFEIDSEPGEGSKIILEVPLNGDE
jgi:PAS domain S-box-containing protein